MIYLWALLLTVVNAVWLGLVLLGLPGNWLILGSTVVAALLIDDMIGKWTLMTLLGLAVLGEILEFMAGVFGAKSAGGSRGGAFGALLGGIIGAVAGTFVIAIPIMGSLIGACGGAFCGALAFEIAGGRELRPAMRSGVGAGVGRFVGTLTKLAVGVAMWLVAGVAAFLN